MQYRYGDNILHTWERIWYSSREQSFLFVPKVNNTSLVKALALRLYDKTQRERLVKNRSHGNLELFYAVAIITVCESYQNVIVRIKANIIVTGAKRPVALVTNCCEIQSFVRDYRLCWMDFRCASLLVVGLFVPIVRHGNVLVIFNPVVGF